MPDAAVVAMISDTEARTLTDRIRSAAEDLWALLLEAHDRQAWKVIVRPDGQVGYDTWADYVETEFSMTRRRAYQLVDQGRVVREIETAAGVCTDVHITEAQARDLKPQLPEVADRVRREVNGHRDAHPEATDDEVQQVVRKAVDEERQRINREREDRQAIADLNAKAPDGYDAAADRAAMQARSRLYRAVELLADLPDPEAMADAVPDWERDNLVLAHDALGWLGTFLDRWDAR